MSDTPQLLTRNNLADMFGVTASTIDRWRNSGTFPQPLPLPGRSVRWARTDIDAWIAGHRITPNTTGLRAAATEAMGL